MKSGNIRLSEKHGLNPSLGICFWCGEDDGTVVIPGRLPGDAEAPRRAVWTQNPCPTCEANMAQGITLMESADGKRFTGRWLVLKPEAFDRLFTIPRPPKDKAFIEPALFDKLVEMNRGPA